MKHFRILLIRVKLHNSTICNTCCEESTAIIVGLCPQIFAWVAQFFIRLHCLMEWAGRHEEKLYSRIIGSGKLLNRLLDCKIDSRQSLDNWRLTIDKQNNSTSRGFYVVAFQFSQSTVEIQWKTPAALQASKIDNKNIKNK